MVRELLVDNERTEEAGELALVLGLITGLVALTTTMAQVERGANRIYGVERDRPALWKYLRAVVLALGAGLPALFGFLVLVGGGPLGDSVQRHYAWGEVAHTIWDVLRWPLSLGADRVRRGGALPVRPAPPPAEPVLAALRRRARPPRCGGWPACCWRRTCGSATASARPTAR